MAGRTSTGSKRPDHRKGTDTLIVELDRSLAALARRKRQLVTATKWDDEAWKALVYMETQIARARAPVMSEQRQAEKAAERAGDALAEDPVATIGKVFDNLTPLQQREVIQQLARKHNGERDAG